MNFEDLKAYFNKGSFPGTLPEDLYLTIRYLSLAPESFHQAKDAAMYFGRVDAKILVKYLYRSIPIQQAPWFKYILSKKKKPEEIIPYIARHFNCSYRHAGEILLIFKKNMVDLYPVFGLKKKKGK